MDVVLRKLARKAITKEEEKETTSAHTRARTRTKMGITRENNKTSVQSASERAFWFVGSILKARKVKQKKTKTKKRGRRPSK